MDTFRVRLNCIDHYQATPNDEFDPRVPRSAASEPLKTRPTVSVIRVFGATESGQKVLVHVHGAFQYTYIEYSGSLALEDVGLAIRTLHVSIDHALAVSYRKNIYEGKHHYVAHISLVKGVPFYGYHVGYKFYLKIYLLNPLHMTRLSDLLREGAVMKRVLQPYESHMQYLAQWMCDYNLFGCGYMDCANVKFRGPIPSYTDLVHPLHSWHDQSIPTDHVSDELALPKQSHCALEVDLCVQDILNRQSVEARYIHHDFIERLHPIPSDAKLVTSTAGLWKDETRRRKARMGLKDANSTPFPPEVLISMSAEPRNNNPGGWIHEEEYKEKIAQLAAEEHLSSNRRPVTFENFVKPTPMEENIRTALQSVEDLYPENFQVSTSQPSFGSSENGESVNAEEKVVVDESRLQAVADNIQEGLTSKEDLKASAPTLNGQPSDHLVQSPISSAEYAKLGIRRNGDNSSEEDDMFIVPKDYLNTSPVSPNAKKRTRFAELPESYSNKRRKVLVDEEHVFPETSYSGSDEDAQPLEDLDLNADLYSSNFEPDRIASFKKRLSATQDGLSVARDQNLTKIKSPANSQNLVLNFPVVKNPHDPNTILRLSQASDSSQKPPSQATKQGPESPVATKTPNKSTNSILLKTPTTAGTITSIKSWQTEPIVIKGLKAAKPRRNVLIFQIRPPSANVVAKTMAAEGRPDVIYQDAYYSKEDDVPDLPREYAGREFKLESATIPYLPEFDGSGSSLASLGRKVPIAIDHGIEEVADRQRRKRCTMRYWSIAEAPPRRFEVEAWLQHENETAKSQSTETVPNQPKVTALFSQIEGPTLQNKHGVKYHRKQAATSVQHETQYMSIMSLEVHVDTRGSLAPNPEHDTISCVFWSIQIDDGDRSSQAKARGKKTGILVVADGSHTAKGISRTAAIDVTEESTELDVLTKLVDIVREYDPDILTGFEVHNSSWGYLIERARLKYDLNYCDELSRMKSHSHGRFGRDDDRWGFNHTSTVRVTGRHTINIWRAMRSELNLLQYTMENIVFHLLQKRIPHYPFADLTKWYRSKNSRDVSKVIEYFCNRTLLDLEILAANELVPRTSEQARLIGVDWFSVISRGSQFKVESLMFRIAKPENLILISPSRRQVGGQNALECLPLVMEPQSDFYSSPLLVLDFQSLYPSVMIAYNYCYSTFLGRIVKWRGTNKMGFSEYRRTERLIELLKDYINIAPNGIMYVKGEIRKSLLAKMLSEILETRVMVKSGMKVDKDDRTLQTLLNNRQLALKLIANVTYGYTSASFSGRMPCSEIADSIVQTARETLEKTIALIHSVERWGAEVVYGDTDSLFVYLKGRTRAQAFDIGEEIADTVTKMNPRPVKLKFEKVYHPCVLLAKKRYVGFKYEHRNQESPDFDAKGIETVRRDGTPAEQKIEESALKILFRTADLSTVKSFFQAQCAKIMKGKVSIQDFCFAKEVRLGTYSDKGPPPPGALISARRMLEDPRLEPQYGERVPYLVVTGGPGARLIDRCVAPEVLLNDAHSELDAEYYISKNIIPPLERIFNLVGANVRQWYDEMPKYQRIRRVEAGLLTDGKDANITKKTLESYMKSSTCLVCREPLDSERGLCNSCFDQTAQSLLFLRTKLMKAEKKTAQLEKVCRSCSGLSWKEDIKCDSKDCPVFYSRTRQKSALANEEAQIHPAIEALQQREETGIEW